MGEVDTSRVNAFIASLPEVLRFSLMEEIRKSPAIMTPYISLLMLDPDPMKAIATDQILAIREVMEPQKHPQRSHLWPVTRSYAEKAVEILSSSLRAVNQPVPSSGLGGGAEKKESRGDISPAVNAVVGLFCELVSIPIKKKQASAASRLAHERAGLAAEERASQMQSQTEALDAELEALKKRGQVEIEIKKQTIALDQSVEETKKIYGQYLPEKPAPSGILAATNVGRKAAIGAAAVGGTLLIIGIIIASLKRRKGKR